jgi:hypothetical protein
MAVNEYAGKPRKGRTLLNYTSDADSHSFELNTQDFIASVFLMNKGQTILSVLQSDYSGYHVTITRSLEEVVFGDRRVRIDLEIEYDDGGSGIEILYSNRFDAKLSKELIISNRTDLETLTIYLAGRAIEIDAPGFVPIQVNIVEDEESSLKHIRFFSLYAPSEIDDTTIPNMWRLWFKDRLETASGYPTFAQAFRAYLRGGTGLFGSEAFWDSRGLHIDKPVPEDYENRDAGLLTEWEVFAGPTPAMEPPPIDGLPWRGGYIPG